MKADIRKMIPSRRKRKQGIIQRISQALDGAVKSGSRRIPKKEVLEPVRNRMPTANKGITQYQRGVVPNKSKRKNRIITSQHAQRDGQIKDPVFGGKVHRIEVTTERKKYTEYFDAQKASVVGWGWGVSMLGEKLLTD